jgi:paraquat-inducible protein B
MSDQSASIAEAVIKPQQRFSKIWFLPIITLLIGGWIAIEQWRNQGPLIQIEFINATGIEAGKTSIKTRNVLVGTVTKIELKDDLTGVIATARMEPDTEHLLGVDAQFWIVSPKVSISGVSGLSTLISGPYIELSAATEIKNVREFVALENPPVTPPGTPGLHLTLNSNDEFAFKEGDPIIYKGLKVGEFEDIYFHLDERIVYYNAFIEAPYHRLITTNTKFWNVSGVRFELSAAGVNIETASVETLLTNGVTFGIPEGLPSGEQVTERSFFDIYPSYEEASDERFKLGANFVILINDTIRGLSVGAPVEYRGLEVGRVIDINPPELIVNGILDEGIDIPVVIAIQPGRVQQPDNQVGLERVYTQTMHWVERGLRASLKMGNLVTGAMYVDLQHYEDAQPYQSQNLLGYEVIPTVVGEFTQLTEKANQLLDNLNDIPLGEIATNLNKTLVDMQNTAASFSDTSQQFSDLANKIDQQGLSENINALLITTKQILKDYSAGSSTHAELNQALKELQQTLNAAQPILNQLNQTPNSLIFSSGNNDEPQPKAQP